MAIRRVADLPPLTGDELRISRLSSALLEISYEDDPENRKFEYSSRNITMAELTTSLNWDVKYEDIDLSGIKSFKDGIRVGSEDNDRNIGLQLTGDLSANSPEDSAFLKFNDIALSAGQNGLKVDDTGIVIDGVVQSMRLESTDGGDGLAATNVDWVKGQIGAVSTVLSSAIPGSVGSLSGSGI